MLQDLQEFSWWKYNLQGFFKFKAMGFIQILETLLKLVVGISLAI
jgi:hypothetical protein